MSLGLAIAVTVGSYAAGCVTAGYYLVRWRTGRDLRDCASGNAGARNAGRVLGPAGFLVTFLLDAGKGAAVVLAAQRLGLDRLVVLGALLAVVAGHIWPVQLRGRGGKGAATSLGAWVVFDPRLVLVCVGVAAIAWLGSRKFTLSGLLAFALLPVAAAFAHRPGGVIAGAAVLTGLILWTHRGNLRDEFTRRRARGPANNPADPWLEKKP